MEGSSQSAISYNIFRDNLDAGIDVRFSDYTIINDNTIYGSTNGIYIGVASWGIQIFHNIITDDAIGISTYFSDGTNISSNTIANISKRGLFLDNSSSNVLYHNNFINYGLDPHIFCIGGPKNRWVGNYWDRSRLLPKFIVGKKISYITPNIHVMLPTIEIDRYPAQEPYDIP
jgi:parallel beta-helix repeat protein